MSLASVMPDFNEKLEQVSALRKKCRQCDEDLYRARLKILRSKNQLRRALEGVTVRASDRLDRIATLRSEMSEIDAGLAALRETVRQLGEWFAEFKEKEQLAGHLKTALDAIDQRIASLKARLDELSREQPRREELVLEAKAELERLGSERRDIEASLRRSLETVEQLRQKEADKRRGLGEKQREIDHLRSDLESKHGEFVELSQPTSANIDETRSAHDAAIASETRLKHDCGDCEVELHDAIEDLYADRSPREAIRSLDDRIPFLLFPLRLETIFVPRPSDNDPRAMELWVRVYPDDIVVYTHEELLTDKEVASGELYWTELLTAEHLNEERDNRRRAAWRYLVELYGGNRAAWVAERTRPTDWESLASGAASRTLIELLESGDATFLDKLLATDISESTRRELQDAVDENNSDAFIRLATNNKWLTRINEVVRSFITGFPIHDLTAPDRWTRAPRTTFLPDKFVLVLYPKGSAEHREVPGNLLPDTLFLGPDPLDAKSAFEKNSPDGPLSYGESFKWMSDFDTAVEKGLGFKVRLTGTEARIGFQRVMVLGCSLSTKPADAATMVEELIANHHYSPNGFSIVPQGTATNNTDEGGTGYSDNDPYDDLAFFTPTGQSAFDPNDPDPRKSQTDGRMLADALGIEYTALRAVQHANGADILDARSMNTALFPATLGYWLKRWISPVISEANARRTRSFFSRYVSGRGPVPALRVGNQPYGILLTSDFSRWRYRDHSDPDPVDPGQTSFLKDLHGLLSALEKVWDAKVQDLMFVGKAGSDPAEVLLNLLAQHPCSVEFYQRTGFSHEYLRNQANFKGDGRFAGELNSHMLGMPSIAGSYLRSLGVDRDDKTVGDMQSLRVLWQHFTTALDAPNLIEDKPLSETNALTINYIAFLAAAQTSEKIIGQDFPGGPPTALLYLYLRNALLLQLHNGAYEWLKERTDLEFELERAVTATTLPEMQDTLPNLSRFEIMATLVGAAEPTHPAHLSSVADLLWNGIPSAAESEADFLKEQRSSLENLVIASTAQLERAFVEHLDCCNYRLDAWQTGLFTHRLLEQRRSSEGRTKGIHLGAFGWLEDLAPSTKNFLTKADLPESIRPTDDQPILEEDDTIAASRSRGDEIGARRAGFVHAPSLNHAAAAALLRNAYLTHATPSDPGMFSVNLSSERVRRGEFILKGMRNGQPIEALLGYQFERGLHDQTSASAARGDNPVLVLNQFILPMREAFQFDAIEVVQEGTEAASELIPPYSVVNGIKLSEATLSQANGFGTSNVLPAAERPNADQGAAIIREQERLRDSLDAVKDLLLAENAFQLARGNFDRVAAVSLAQRDVHIPPELEVISTPRGSQFTFTNRVTLHFEDLDPGVPENNPWPTVPLTPRAIAETGINKWLGSLFAPPDKTICNVYWIEQDDVAREPDDVNRHDEHKVTAADLGIQPIDFVWITSRNIHAVQGATEIETRIAFHYRRTHGISDEKLVRIEFDPDIDPESFSFAQYFLLARKLHGLLSQSRALSAEDFLPASGEVPTAQTTNPKGFDAGELRARLESSLNALIQLADAIDGPAAPDVQIEVSDPAPITTVESFTGKLHDAYAFLENKKLSFTDSERVAINFSLADAETLHRNLRKISSFGISDTFPPESGLTSDRAKAPVLARAQRTARRLREPEKKTGVLDRVEEILNSSLSNKPVEALVALLLEAGRTILGDDFGWIPKFVYQNEADLIAAFNGRDQLLAYTLTESPGITKEQVVDEWLQGVARVRKPLGKWTLVKTLADALSDAELGLQPIQVPFRANDSWLAVEFPEKDPNNTDLDDADKPFGISRDTLSIVAHGGSAFTPGTRQSGILLDDWTEEIPTGEETTGISFRFNQPNAAPPQTILLAVTPQETGSWDWDDLLGTLVDTLARAKRRAVEPSQLETQGSAWNALTPALVSEFSTAASSDVSLDLMKMMDFGRLNDFYVTRL